MAFLKIIGWWFSLTGLWYDKVMYSLSTHGVIYLFLMITCASVGCNLVLVKIYGIMSIGSSPRFTPPMYDYLHFLLKNAYLKCHLVNYNLSSLKQMLVRNWWVNSASNNIFNLSIASVLPPPSANCPINPFLCFNLYKQLNISAKQRWCQGIHVQIKSNMEIQQEPAVICPFVNPSLDP